MVAWLSSKFGQQLYRAGGSAAMDGEASDCIFSHLRTQGGVFEEPVNGDSEGVGIGDFDDIECTRFGCLLTSL